MRDDRERPRDMLKAIDHISAKTTGGREAFESDEMLKVWVRHHLQIVGEAARCLSSEFRERHSDKVWSMAAGMRHILVHHYFEIDAEQVWRVIDHDLAPLRRRVTEILQGAETDPA